MLKQIEGSQGVAEAVSLCRPNVVCAYPISPQTHIVEALGRMVRAGAVENCEYMNVESEFGAMSVAIGASAAGARTYTATASQGLLFMAEAIYSASGLGLPIVMTVANRAIGAPINIWNDHSDSLSQRDSGWLQLFAEDNQEAVDLHIQAFKIAEELSLPVMVCMDGFVLTHALERMDVPSQEEVDKFLPPFSPRQVLDPDNPVSIGAMVGPEAFTEVRCLAQHRFEEALEVIPRVSEEFAAVTGRRTGGLLSEYRTEGAKIRVIGMGSCIGTAKDAVDELIDDGVSVGIVSLKSFRPFPYEAVRKALEGAEKVIVLDRTMTPGSRGVLGMEVESALRGLDIEVCTVVTGLGGRAVTRRSIRETVRAAEEGKLPPMSFMDLNQSLVDRQIEREAACRLSGPAPEQMAHDAAAGGGLLSHVSERNA